MKRKNQALILLFLVLVILPSLIVIWTQSQYNKPAKKDITLTFVNVGWIYQLRNNQDQEEWKLFEGQINITEGTEIRLSITRDDYTKTSGFMFNDTFVEGDSIKFKVNQTYIIRAIIIVTRLKKTLDTLKQNNIIPIAIDNFKRTKGFSSSLTYIKIRTLGDFINFCQNKTGILHLRGRLQNQGLIWDFWDYYILIENGTVYYLREDST